MHKGRTMHFAVAIGEYLYVFGGESCYNATVEIFDGENWKLGDEFPFPLNRGNAQVIVDRELIIVVTNEDGVLVYDAREHTIKEFNKHALREYRKEHAALLQ